MRSGAICARGALSTEIPGRLAPLENRLAAVRCVRSFGHPRSRSTAIKPCRSSEFSSSGNETSPASGSCYISLSQRDLSTVKLCSVPQKVVRKEVRLSNGLITINATRGEEFVECLKCRPLLACRALLSRLIVMVSCVGGCDMGIFIGEW